MFWRQTGQGAVVNHAGWRSYRARQHCTQARWLQSVIALSAGHEYPAHYVGKSQDLTKRWANHWASTAAKWTARHRPVRVVRVDLERGDSYADSRSHEDEVTLALMREAQRLHGANAWASVRGGRYTAITMGRPHEL